MGPDTDAIFRRFVSKAKVRHFVVLVRLCELGNMKRVADALGLSQPAVSMMISELERLLGTQLFLRHARGVEPTAVTAELIPVARRIIAAIGDGSEIVSNVVNELAGYVRVSSTPAAVSSMLFPMVRVFTRRFPGVHIELTEINAANPLQAIADGLADLMCLRKPEVVPEGWIFESCLSDALVVICGAQHPLASRAEASQEDLAGCDWLLTRRGSVARERFEEVASELHLPLKNRCGVITHVPMLTLELLTSQDYVTLIPRSVAAPWLRQGLVREVVSPATTELPPLGVLWEGEASRRVTRLLVSELKDHLGPV